MNVLTVVMALLSALSNATASVLQRRAAVEPLIEMPARCVGASTTPPPVYAPLPEDPLSVNVFASTTVTIQLVFMLALPAPFRIAH